MVEEIIKDLETLKDIEQDFIAEDLECILVIQGLVELANKHINHYEETGEEEKAQAIRFLFNIDKIVGEIHEDVECDVDGLE